MVVDGILDVFGKRDVENVFKDATLPLIPKNTTK